MKVLFLSISSFDDFSKQGLYNDLLREFRKNGHDVYIVSAEERKKNTQTTLENREGVQILKVKTGNLFNVGFLEKGISNVLLGKQFIKAIKNELTDIKFDLILYATPPITLVNVVKYVKERDNAKTYLLLKDIFPQNALDLGILSEGNPVYKYFKWKEKTMYNISDSIGCMSPKNVEYLLENNPDINPEKVEICPNTLTPVTVKMSQAKKEYVRAKYNIPLNKTVFLYGGNLGKPQGIDFLIKCIEENEKNTQSFLLVIGTGTEFQKLKIFFEKYRPENSMLLEKLQKEDYELVANTSDVGLVFLDYRFKIPNFPSRILSYMQASIPIIAATDPNTDLGEVIEEGEFGVSCHSNDVNQFNNLVKLLSNDSLRKRMGRNAREHLEQNYTSAHSYDTIMRNFEQKRR